MKAREAIHRFLCKSADFIMLYTGDFVLRYYVGFSQIRSHLRKKLWYVCIYLQKFTIICVCMNTISV